MFLSTYLSFRFAKGKNRVPKIILSIILISFASTIPVSPLWYILGGPAPFLSLPAYSLVDKVWAPDYGYSEPGWIWVHKINFLTITLNSAPLDALNIPSDYFSRTILYFLLVNSAGALLGAVLGYREKRRVLRSRTCENAHLHLFQFVSNYNSTLGKRLLEPNLRHC